jgi:hypothetical protein
MPRMGFYYSANFVPAGLLCVPQNKGEWQRAAFACTDLRSQNNRSIFLNNLVNLTGGQMQRKSITSKSFWIMIIAGMTTGMGNGSVFGAAMMCLLGRGKFDDWGGWYGMAYSPSTFTGFIDLCMIVFGLAFVGIVWAGLAMHDKLENEPA